jgi:predicted DsbA family dithiol-disulfide isomerase
MKPQTDRLQIEVFSDIACPFCFIGDTRLTRILEAYQHLEIDWHWHPFQLQPDLPKRGLPWETFSRQKFGSLEGRRAAFAQVVQNGASEGIEFDFERMPVAPNTSDAHRLVLYASAQGLGKATSSALYRAYFCQALDITDPAELERIAVNVGLESGVRELLSGVHLQNEVRASQAQASKLGISGVPFYIFNQKYALSGAQTPAVFEMALNRALEASATPL